MGTACVYVGCWAASDGLLDDGQTGLMSHPIRFSRLTKPFHLNTQCSAVPSAQSFSIDDQ
jgi:hypothetical protein